MEGIKPIWTEMPLQLRGVQRAAAAEEETPVTFLNVFKDAIEGVKETDAEKSALEYMLSTGQLDNAASVMIASSKAQLSVQYLVSLRKAALDSYNELIRINL